MPRIRKQILCSTIGELVEALRGFPDSTPLFDNGGGSFVDSGILVTTQEIYNGTHEFLKLEFEEDI